MVVDDVLDDREAVGVRGRDELGVALGAAVARLGRRQVDAVVAPTAGAGELGDRHQLDRGDPELRQLREVGDGAGERPLLAEGADVQLVDDQVGQQGRDEAVGGAGQRPRVEQTRRPPQPLGLPARARVRERLVIDEVDVVVAGLRRHHALEDAVPGRIEFIGAVGDPQAQLRGARRPHAELAAAVTQRPGAERALPGIDDEGVLRAGGHREELIRKWPGALSGGQDGGRCRRTSPVAYPPSEPGNRRLGRC